MRSETRKDISLLTEILQRHPCGICNRVIQADAIILINFYHDRQPIICHYACDIDGENISDTMAEARRKLDRDVLKTYHPRPSESWHDRRRKD